MRRESRTLMVIAVLALGGVVALGVTAHRYSKLVAEEGASGGDADRPAAGTAARAVADFVRVRTALADELGGLGQPSGQADPRAARLNAIRDRELNTVGMAREEYVMVRRAYRSWRAGRAVGAPALERALERRRGDLESLDLGPWEAFDR